MQWMSRGTRWPSPKAGEPSEGGRDPLRGTPTLDDWAAFIVNGGRSKRLILADRTSERRLTALLGRPEGLPTREIKRLAKS
jgi:hypothetical protein